MKISTKHTSGLMVLALFLNAGCTTPTRETTSNLSVSGNGPHETVTVVSASGDEDDDIPSCVATRLKEADPKRTFVPARRFRDALYPWFEPGTRPETTKGLAELLSRRGVREQVTKLGVRYVIVIGGATTRTTTERFGGCAGDGRGGCLAGMSRSKATNITASILDLKTARHSGSAAASMSGEEHFGVLFVIPYYFPAATETITCQRIADRLATALREGSK
jgi:hypothetical protein